MFIVIFHERNEDFIRWWSNLGCNSLFFNDASKGNLGIGGARGVIFDTKQRKHKEYAWGIRKKYNNGVEWLALIKGLEITGSRGIEEMAVFGEPLMVAREERNLSNNHKSSSIKLQYTFEYLVSDFKILKFFHIMRENNKQADQMANKGVLNGCGILICNEEGHQRSWIP